MQTQVYRKITLKEGQNIFFTSDTHAFHKNITKGETSWTHSTSVRDFQTKEEMTNEVARSINNYVREDDILVHLGDWSFNGQDKIELFRSMINCKNILFITGNHDHHILRNSDYLSREVFNLGIYPRLDLQVNSPDGTTFYAILHHFPIAIWDKAHQGAIHLYGHVHGSYQHPGRALDVGVDNAYKMFDEYRPFTLHDIRKFMAGREFVQMSHHDRFTN